MSNLEEESLKLASHIDYAVTAWRDCGVRLTQRDKEWLMWANRISPPRGDAINTNGAAEYLCDFLNELKSSEFCDKILYDNQNKKAKELAVWYNDRL